MAIVECTSCGKKYSDRAGDCPYCEKKKPEQILAHVPPAQIHLISGIIGTILLLVGSFSPVLRLPVVGSVNYFQNGKGDGVFIAILCVVSLFIILQKKIRALLITGTLSLAVLTFTFVNIQTKINNVKNQLAVDLAGNPFMGLADMAVQSIEMEWGWGVLVAGAALQIFAAFSYNQHEKEIRQSL